MCIVCARVAQEFEPDWPDMREKQMAETKRPFICVEEKAVTSTPIPSTRNNIFNRREHHEGRSSARR
jgi:hypothetical protein